MDEAPTPKPFFQKPESLNLNKLSSKSEYVHKEYKITLGLYDEYLILSINSNNDNSCFQLKQTFEELTENIPNFKILNDTSSLLSLMQQLFETNKYDIKKEGEILKVIIKITNLLGKDEEYELILKKAELNDKQRMDMMEEKIKDLENKVNNFLTEREELNKQIKILIDENKSIKEELSLIKKNLNLIENSDKNQKIQTITKNSNLKTQNNKSNIFNSKIFNQLSDINFILDEIKKIGQNIRGVNLIYRATEEGDKIEKFNNICSNIENELIIIKTNKNYIFGGFTKTGWKENKGKDFYDSNAFIFSYNLKKIYNIKKPEYALHCQSGDCRLSFGSTSYAILIGNNFLAKYSGRIDKMDDYSGESSEREINGGDKEYKVLELEVFQITF
jgi:hypothetical protein